MMNGDDEIKLVNIEANLMDYCGVCGKYIDLCFPHSYDLEKGRAVHRECA